jgi:zinc protease
MVDTFLAEGIDPEQFERIKFRIEAGKIYDEDDTQGLARTYGTELTTGLSVADVEAWTSILADVTPEDVMAAARRLFDDPSTVTGYLMRPEEPQNDPVEVSQ